MKNKTYSLPFRLMHWAIAFCMLFMLLTIFLRTNWMDRHAMADTMNQVFDKDGVSVPIDSVEMAARKVRGVMWKWHIYVGYVLVGLYTIRLALPFFGEMKLESPFKSGLSAKDRLKLLSYIIFHLGAVTSLITGLFLEFGPENLEHTMEEIHVLSLYYLLPFIFIHFAGVLLAELGKESGIISRVINGKN